MPRAFDVDIGESYYIADNVKAYFKIGNLIGRDPAGSLYRIGVRFGFLV